MGEFTKAAEERRIEAMSHAGHEPEPADRASEVSMTPEVTRH